MSDQPRPSARRSRQRSPRLVGCPTSAPSALVTRPQSRTSASRQRMPEPTRPECSRTMRSGPRSSCCPTCIGIRIWRSSWRPTTAGWSATSSAPPTRTRSRTGSTTSGGPSAGSGGRSPCVEQSRQDGTLIYAYSRRAGAEPYAEDYPAHLHIDLLPEVQGQGWGRLLIATLVDALRERGVAGTAPRGIHRQHRRDRVLPPRRVHRDPVA